MLNKLLFYIKKFFEIYSLRTKVQKISYKGNRQGTVVFNELGCCIADLNAEHYMAYLMACDGYKVKILLDDFQLEHWEYILNSRSFEDYKFHKSLKNKFLRNFYSKLSNWVFAHENIEIIYYSQMLKGTPSDLELSQSDKNQAESSVRKYFQSGVMDWANLEHKKYYEVCLKNCLISKRIGHWVYQKLNPDLFVSVHGFYSAFGPAYDYLKDKGVQCAFFYTSVYRPQTLHALETVYPYLHLDGNWQKFKNHPITEDLKRTVDQYFSARINGQAVDTAMIFKGIETPKAEKINVKGAQKVFGLFPNVIWDGDVVERITIFKTAADWIVETIRFFEKNHHLHLILRFHPAEATILSYGKKLEPVIRQRVPHLDKIENITVIPCDAPINTYGLIKENVDIGLIFEGMMALELPFLGKPVIMSSRARTSKTGVAFEPKSKEEYLELLANPDRVIQEFEVGVYKEKMYLFSYWYLYESCLDFPLFHKQKFGYINYEVESHNLDPAQSTRLKRTVDYFSTFVERHNNELI